MAELEWYDNTVIPDRATLQIPRRDLKLPLEGYAMVQPTVPEQPMFVTKLYVAGDRIVADNYEELNILLEDRVTYLDGAYDQLARLWCAYIEAGQGKLYWYDPLEADFVTTSFSPCVNVQLFLDDLRWESNASGGNTVILMYEHNQAVYYRLQADRFLIEYLLVGLKEDEHLISAGLNKKYRIQVLLQRNAITKEPQLGDAIIYSVVVNDVPVAVNENLVVEEVVNVYNNPA